MCFDITAWLQKDNEIVICVTDDLRGNVQPYGKQTLKRGGMWYTPVSGIWQSVWMENVPDRYIRKLQICNRGTSVTVDVGDKNLCGKVTVAGVGEFLLEAGMVTITPENPHLWSPEDPYLYQMTVEAGEDRLQSYFALRTLEIRTVDGIPRLCLNGKPYFSTACWIRDIGPTVCSHLRSRIAIAMISWQ
jgi:beta-galactosidase/beta-glucuronidase